MEIKKLFEYLREVYQLKTKIVLEYKKFDSEINIEDFKKTYSSIADIHEFSQDISNDEEYFVLKYINKKKEIPQLPNDLKEKMWLAVH